MNNVYILLMNFYFTLLYSNNDDENSILHIIKLCVFDVRRKSLMFVFVPSLIKNYDARTNIIY